MVTLGVIGAALLLLVFLIGAAESGLNPKGARFPAKSKTGGVARISDDRSQKGPQDRKRINLSEDYAVRYWSEKVAVTPEQLREAVNKVGNSAAAVEQELKSAA
jgi:Protein of unknown function (DUF3606)